MHRQLSKSELLAVTQALQSRKQLEMTIPSHAVDWHDSFGSDAFCKHPQVGNACVATGMNVTRTCRLKPASQLPATFILQIAGP